MSVAAGSLYHLHFIIILLTPGHQLSSLQLYPVRPCTGLCTYMLRCAHSWRRVKITELLRLFLQFSQHKCFSLGWRQSGKDKRPGQRWTSHTPWKLNSQIVHCGVLEYDTVYSGRLLRPPENFVSHELWSYWDDGQGLGRSCATHSSTSNLHNRYVVRPTRCKLFLEIHFT